MTCELAISFDFSPECGLVGTRPVQRSLLYPQELYRVSPNYSRVRVLQGSAYITYNGCDIILQRGETVALNRESDAVLISGLGDQMLIIELCEAKP